MNAGKEWAINIIDVCIGLGVGIYFLGFCWGMAVNAYYNIRAMRERKKKDDE